MNYATGALSLVQNDLQSAGFGIVWGHTRSYSNRNNNNAAGLNGSSWMVRELRYLTFQGDAGSGKPAKICVVSGPQSSVWFEVAADGSYKNTYGGLSTLTWDADMQEFFFGTSAGESWVFADHTVSAIRGKLVRIIDPASQFATLLYDASGRLTTFSQTVGGRAASYDYEYATVGASTSRLSSVTYRLDGRNVRRASFEYYTSTETRGNLGDLCLASVQEWSQGTGTWATVRKSHYRYYRSGDANGFEHGLKFAIEPAAFEQMLKAGLDPLRAGESELASFADYYFEYDSIKRVSKESVKGGQQTYSYFFEDQVPEPASTDVNAWATRCTETRPDGSVKRVYCNAAGSSILNILTEPAAAGGRVWNEYSQYDSTYRLVLFAHPSAVQSVSQPAGPGSPLSVTLRSSSGLIEVTEFYSTTNPATGAVSGLLHRRGTRQGTSGTIQYTQKFEYLQQTAADQTINKVKAEYVYTTAGMPDNQAPKTSYNYTWHLNSSGGPTLQVLERVRTFPVVSTAENGTGTTQQDRQVFDTNGRLTWEMNARGVISYRSYVIATGALLQRIEDVDTSRMNDVPPGWSTLSGFGLHLITDYKSDAQGRTTMELGPWHEVQLNPEDTEPTAVRTVQYTVYNDEAHEVRRATGWMRGQGESVEYNTVGGVSITRSDASRNVIEEITSARECSCGPISSQESLPQPRWSRWTKYIRDAWGRQIAERRYFAIPPYGEGEKDANFYESYQTYDEMGRKSRWIDFTGTIEKTSYDVRSLVVAIAIGTQDGAASNLLTVAQNIYDNGTGGGDGLLTETRLPVDSTSGNDRVTTRAYDYRGNLNLLTTNDGTRNLLTATEYDNLSRPTQVTDYHTSVANSNRTRRSRRLYDARSRVYKQEIDGIDPATGNVTATLTGQKWYDAVGNVIKASNPGRNAFTKVVFDGLNRPTTTYLACVPGQSGVPSGCTNDVSSDTVLEQSEEGYDAAGNSTETRLRKRLDTASGTGSLLGPTGAQPQARVSYQMYWPDAIGRQRNTADYGTNGGLPPVRPGTAPARSDTILVATTLYKDSGDANRSIDPMGIETRWENDHLGRRIKLMEGIVVGSLAKTSSSDALSARTTEFAYHASGQIQRLTLRNPTTGDQVTRWIFGTTLTESGLASNRLLRAKIYPESDDRPAPLDSGPDGVYARLEYTYNRQADVVRYTDADGTVHEYSYSKTGQLMDDHVPTLASHLDGAVRRISRAYDNRGLLSKVTSHSAVSGGSIVNEVGLKYGPFGELVEDAQSHTGAVTGTTPKVGYAYTTGTGNVLRRISITYPNGRVLNYLYGAALSVDDHLNRVSAEKVHGEGADLVQYTYAGAAWQVQIQNPQPNLELTYKRQPGAPIGDAGDIYSGYDRFDRTQEILWIKNS